jgi:hypothetical protein
MKMMNKKGMWQKVVEIIVVLIVFLVLIATLFPLFERVEKSSLHLIKTEREKFLYMGGSYIHPDLMGTDMADFWFTGFKNFLKEAPTAQNTCLGSFYVDSRWNMQDTSVRFLQTSTGIEIMLLDADHVAGAIDNKTFANEEGKSPWKLCIINTDFTTFTNVVKYLFENDKPLEVSDSWITYLNDATIDFKSDIKDENMVVSYFTPEVLNKPDMRAEEADYQALIVNDGSATHGFSYVDYERFIFLFIVKGNNFCILPSTTTSANAKAFDANVLSRLLKQQIKTDVSSTPFTGMRIDDSNFKLFCPIPGGDKSIEKSIFTGYNSCYYNGCDDMNFNVDGLRACNDVYEKCRGVCAEDSNKIVGLFHGGSICVSCHEIKKCKDYNEAASCIKDLCGLSCKYDAVNKECVPIPVEPI